MGVVEGITAASAALGLLGQLTGTGTNKNRSSGLSSGMQGLEDSIANYYRNMASQPTQYTPVNQGNYDAMNILYNAYRGKPYTVTGLQSVGQNQGTGGYGQTGMPSQSMYPSSQVPSYLTGLIGGGTPQQKMGGYYRPMA